MWSEPLIRPLELGREPVPRRCAPYFGIKGRLQTLLAVMADKVPDESIALRLAPQVPTDAMINKVESCYVGIGCDDIRALLA